MSYRTDEFGALHPTDGAAARLRADIDRGRTGDKTEWPDPAAAPLGTDDEAAGTRAPLGKVERPAEASRPPMTPQRLRGPGAAWILIGIIIVIGTAFFALALI